MKSIDLFIPYVELHCRGASVPLMYQALRSAAQEFCNRSQIVQETFLARTVAGIDEIEVELPSQQQYVRIHSVRWKDTQLECVATADVVTNFYVPESGSPRAAYLKTPSAGPIALFPTPDTTEVDVVSVRASFAPTSSATQFSDVLFTDWVDPIASGAVALLHDTQDQPFSTKVPSSHRGRFEQGLQMAKRVAQRGRMIVTRRVQYRAFA